LTKLAVDPEGEWVAAYSAVGTVVNPNEIVLLSLESGEQLSKTIRSFGGQPVDLTFTPAMQLPNGEAHRFLVVRTERDVALIDLLDRQRNEITLQLSETPDGNTGVPLEVVASPGGPSEPAQLA